MCYSLFSTFETRLAAMQYDIQYTLPITVITYFDAHIFIDWTQDSSSNWLLAAVDMFLWLFRNLFAFWHNKMFQTHLVIFLFDPALGVLAYFVEANILMLGYIRSSRVLDSSLSSWTRQGAHSNHFWKYIGIGWLREVKIETWHFRTAGLWYCIHIIPPYEHQCKMNRLVFCLWNCLVLMPKTYVSSSFVPSLGVSRRTE